ncbi:MAG: homogentisate 1,2-dioxygenase [Bdellovibrionaceae bacterium]|nr:homogentisate 1,2-dioxygenase [Pseudobdellovibrionaceae bacterium]
MSGLRYQTGFGSYFESEAEKGALPEGRNSPQKPIKGLYPEQLSGSAFTMKRSENLRSWLYRLQPSVVQAPFKKYEQKLWTSIVLDDGQTPPDPLRWFPMESVKGVDFIDSIRTMVGNSVAEGSAVHLYSFDKPMGQKYFLNADAEMVIVPYEGSLLIKTEFGHLEVAPVEIAVVPRGVKFAVEALENGKTCSGYLGENLGAPLRLPELGPIGSNGLANPRDFQFPVAAFEAKKEASILVCKFQNRFWSSELDHSPLDVVAWHGNYAPYKYNLANFNTIGTISYDHPDPSIFTVLTSPSSVPGRANIDFVIFPPRWLVGENTFRPPYYHRNVMNECMGLIKGVYDAKQGGFLPGGMSVHNCMVPHGPDTKTYFNEIAREEKPVKVSETMAFMFESSQIYNASAFALKSSKMDTEYWKCWQGLERGR